MDASYCVLIEPLIRVRLQAGAEERATLPGVLAHLVRNGVAEFPAQRPHQRHAWHAFLVQLAALALHRAGVETPPDDEAAWASLLRGLTPAWPGDEPWSLVAPPKAPALLQPPVPEGDLEPFKKVVETPDALDLLVTSKNHDLKSALMADARPDDWLFALVSLQTMEGFMGAGNYGVARMNGGFSSRPCVAVLPPGGPGARFVRDLRVLLRKRAEILASVPFLRETGGLGLLWLEPWDGASQLRPDSLDPFFIEICRRVRLAAIDGHLIALATGSKKARIAADQLKGNIGDPWVPIEVSEVKALSITERGFTYQLMSELLFGENYARAPLQEVQSGDADKDLAVIACALARGQGKTEGYHERIVPLSKRVIGLFSSRATDALAAMAQERVGDVGAMRGKVLRPALISLLEKGPQQVDYGSKSASAQAEPWLARFEREIDTQFFEQLWLEAEHADDTGRRAARGEWLRWLRDTAATTLDAAAEAVPKSSTRRYRARVRARGFFHGQLFKNFPSLKPEASHDDDRTRAVT